MPTRNWFQVMVHSPTGWVIGPALVYGVVAVFGMVYVLRRLYRGKQVSPGEMLWLILGVHQVVFWPAFWAIYKQEAWPLANPPSHEAAFLFCPRLAASIATLFAWSKFRSERAWEIYFMIFFLVFMISAFDGSNPHPMSDEETLVVSIPPLTMAIAAAIATLISLKRAEDIHYRSVLHWFGIAMAFLPYAWFALWCFQGDVRFRPWLQRIRE